MNRNSKDKKSREEKCVCDLSIKQRSRTAIKCLFKMNINLNLYMHGSCEYTRAVCVNGLYKIHCYFFFRSQYKNI